MGKIFLWNGVLALTVVFSCGSSDIKDDTLAPLVHQEAILSGEQLSRKYCQSCHLYPPPAALDKKTWERSVLPLMGRRLGIYENLVPRSDVLAGAIDTKSIIEQDIFPEKPLVSDQEWNRIVEFYLSEAPDSISPHPLVEMGTMADFELFVPEFGKQARGTSLVKYDPETSRVYVGSSSGRLGSLAILDPDFQVQEQIPLPSAPTDLFGGRDHLAIILVGSLRLAPSDNPFGELIYLLRQAGDEKYSSFRKFQNQLNRPVQIHVEDLSGDGIEDMLIAEFGYYTGALSLFENSGTPNALYRKKVIKNVPGAVRTYVRDMNGDGHKDIVALFAQGDECISIFYGDGKGGFEEERVLRFQPSYGSVYFELADFNGDGYLDILYCNGDNGDYPPILKDNHGIRIFENDGADNFEMVYFYPMHGAFKCVAEDFDRDGDLDIFAVSYFPDFAAGKRQDLVYLKNNGGYSFSPLGLKEDLPARWITFDIGDLDGNGYPDIILGASGVYPISPHHSGKGEEAVSLAVLKNVGK